MLSAPVLHRGSWNPAGPFEISCIFSENVPGYFGTFTLWRKCSAPFSKAGSYSSLFWSAFLWSWDAFGVNSRAQWSRTASPRFPSAVGSYSGTACLTGTNRLNRKTAPVWSVRRPLWRLWGLSHTRLSRGFSFFSPILFLSLSSPLLSSPLFPLLATLLLCHPLVLHSFFLPHLILSALC